MEAFLPPIEKPKGLMMKLAITSHAGNLAKCSHASAFGAIANRFRSVLSKIANWTENYTAAETVMLIREQVARINVCLFLHRYWSIVYDQSIDE